MNNFILVKLQKKERIKMPTHLPLTLVSNEVDAPFRFEYEYEVLFLLVDSAFGIARIGEVPMVIGISIRTFLRKHGVMPMI